MSTNGTTERVSCGMDLAFSSDLNSDLDQSLDLGFDFICVPIVHPRLTRDFFHEKVKNRVGPLSRSDFLLSSQDWTTLIVAKITPTLQLDSMNEIVRHNAEHSFNQEVALANHLGLPAIMVQLKNMNNINLARNVNAIAINSHFTLFWVKVPMTAPIVLCDDIFNGGLDLSTAENSNNDSWKWWNQLRILCNYNKKLILVLEITADLPSDAEITRWLGEPVKAIILSTKLFLTNRKGYPVLPRSHQLLLKKFFKLDVQLVLTGKNRHKSKGLSCYKLYLDHLFQQREMPDQISKFSKGYEDYLQCPLQPLMDNLQSQTYEIFEKDPVKYTSYQQAIYLALLDKVKEESKDKIVLTVMVLGAGRGPLVTAALKAAAEAKCLIKVYAVEKNPNAVVTLENLKSDFWGDKVTIVSCDMRFWEPKEKADIIISELLGSFGDNELSPECLDGAERFLKPKCISIPCSYTSYVAPLQSSKLWNEAKLCRESGKPVDSQFETPYVVRLHNSQLISDPQPLFTFDHPRRDVTGSNFIMMKQNLSNERYGELKFPVALDTVLHGFSGYFHCILYKNVSISIVPDTHTPGMFSWFPIYFPLKEPILLKKTDILTVHFWRLVNEKNVWYEWCTSTPQQTHIHNPKGRSYIIGL
ncbi:hypothetical protein HELRODRAFT_68344 [Helobdella robusta]|uniref:Protein arginine N-methyltransferase n=1 Tax=Helobdella robusta TaxID=6412 RepID=T1FZD4_HELRO|nr:hypothetical protein HELRODRAFT_68344 [Helobdella robusta]ESN96246.1 hypothetical protein HELRODRAFT_68344 [Helobdella robusta]